MTVYELTARRDGRHFRQSFRFLTVAICSRMQLRFDGWEVSDPILMNDQDAAPTFARDAGHICERCWRIVSWTDHLPAASAVDPVVCFVDPMPAKSVGVVPQLRLVEGEAA